MGIFTRTHDQACSRVSVRQNPPERVKIVMQSTFLVRSPIYFAPPLLKIFKRDGVLIFEGKEILYGVSTAAGAGTGHGFWV